MQRELAVNTEKNYNLWTLHNSYSSKTFDWKCFASIYIFKHFSNVVAQLTKIRRPVKSNQIE